MDEGKRQEFAEAVAATIAGVQQLSREVDRLIVDMRDRLEEGPGSLKPIRGTLGKTGKDPGRLSVRHEYGLLFGLPNDEPLEEDDELDEEDSDEEGPKEHKSGKLELGANEPLLAVRVVLYDSRHPEQFEPRVEYAVMRKWRTGESTYDGDARFAIAGYMLRRIPKALAMAPSDEPTVGLQTRARAKSLVSGKQSKKKGGAKLRADLPAGIRRVPLFSLDSVEALVGFVREMKATWSRFNAS
jgi:hypothetical protein